MSNNFNHTIAYTAFKTHGKRFAAATLTGGHECKIKTFDCLVKKRLHQNIEHFALFRTVKNIIHLKCFQIVFHTDELWKQIVKKNDCNSVGIPRKKRKSFCYIYIVVHFFNENFSVFGAWTPPNRCFHMLILFHRLIVIQTKRLNNFHLFFFRNYSKNH